MGIYGAGKAFNLRYVQRGQVSNRPHVRAPRGGAISYGSYSKTTNVTINNGPRLGFWAGFFSSGVIGGLFGFLGNIFGGSRSSQYATLNQTQMQPAVQQQAPKTGDRLADLQKMFPNWVITSDGNGNYDAVNKDQTVHESGTFEEMCEKLLNQNKETQPQGTEEQQGNTPTGNPTGQGNEISDGKDKGNGDGGKVEQNHKPNGAQTTQTTQGTGHENKEIDKTKPVSVTIQFSIHTNTTNSGTATVKMPDGTTYTANTGPSLTHNRAMAALADDIRGQLKAAGWTNVTLENSNFKFKQGEQVDATTGASVSATQNKKEWTPAEKQKPITLNIRFAVETLSGNSGTASVTAPDGTKFEVSTGMSLTHQRAMADLSKQMKAKLSQAGWTNVTLENKNFNWSD